MEMVYYVINEYGVSAGFPELIKGFEKIIEIKGFLIGMYLRMMFNSYSEKDILQFANLLISCPRTFKNEIKKLILESIDIDSERYEIKGNIILEKLEL